MKYRLVMYPNTYDTSLESEEFNTVDEAVREGQSRGTDNFLVVIVVDWQAVALNPEELKGGKD